MAEINSELVLPLIASEDCDGCGECVEACVTGALGLVNGRAAVVQGEACDFCGDCEPACPTGAIACLYEVMLAEKSGSPLNLKAWFCER